MKNKIKKRQKTNKKQKKKYKINKIQEKKHKKTEGILVLCKAKTAK